jgi:hypothetical protein
VKDDENGDAIRLRDRAIEIGRLLDSQPYTGNFFWVKAEMFQRLGNLDEAMKAVDESMRVVTAGSDGIGGIEKGSPTFSFVHALTLADAGCDGLDGHARPGSGSMPPSSA